MEIKQFALPSSTAPLLIKAVQSYLSELIVGKVLNATVISKKSPELFLLQIGNQQIEARTKQAKALNVGEQLKLIVEKQGDPITLRVIQQNPSKVVYEAKQQLLRESIPKQAGMEKITPVLNQLSRKIADVIKILPAPVEQQFKKLIEQLPSRNNLNNEAGLKLAIKNSGIFFESKLLTDANNISEPRLKTANPAAKKILSSQISSQTQNLTQPPQIAKDLKTNLLQLSAVINKYKQDMNLQKTLKDNILIKSPTASVIEKTINIKNNSTNRIIEPSLKAEIEILGKYIESSIARIEVNQSKAIVTHDNQMPLWSVEIPVKDKQNIDLLKLNIQADRDSDSNNEKLRRWTTDIKITFENTGTITARLSILDKEVNATLWSDNIILNKIIDNNLSLLNKQIEKRGLSSGNIVCLKEAPIEQNLLRSANSLINITI